jgi:hypothetical protein
MKEQIELINEVRKFLVSYEKENQLTENEFSVFQYINFQEVLMSKIFKDLLNPRGKHGQGSLFLDQFLSLLEIENPILTERFSIITEALTSHLDSNRRIDILLNWNNKFGIGIENKPYTIDQKNQLSDYSIQLSKEFNDNYVLVFLSNRHPYDTSIKEDLLETLTKQKKFKHLDFNHIIKWLEESKKEVKSQKIIYYLEDLINQTKIKMDINNENKYNSDLIKILLNSDENIKATFEIAKSFDGLRIHIAENFVKNLLELFEKEGTKSKFILDLKESKSYRINLTIKRIDKEWGEFSCGLFDYDGEGLHYAINLGKDEKNNREQIVKELTNLKEWKNVDGEYILWKKHYNNKWYNSPEDTIAFKNEEENTYKELMVLINTLNKILCNQ